MRFPWQKKKIPAPVPSADERELGICAAFLQEQGARQWQEDACALLNHQDVVQFRRMGALAVVADGMGGMAEGGLASAMAVNGLTDRFQAEAPLNAPAHWLTAQFKQISNQIFQRLNGMGGSTAVACLIHGNKLWFASVGDSFLYLLRDGELNRLNRPQTVQMRQFQLALEAGSTDPLPGRQHPEAPALTGYLGLQQLEDIDLLGQPLPLQSGDALLLCSDGVGGVLTEEDILYCLRQGKAEEVCCAIRQRVLSKALPCQDNFTAQVIQFIQ